MRTIIDYCIIRREHPTELVAAVREAVKDGWQPIEGCKVTSKEGFNRFSQTLVRYAASPALESFNGI